jgi:hypothetical protein
MAYKVFLSHSARDRDAVAAIANHLGAIGIDVWLFEQHPEPGDSVAKKILDAIPRADAMLVLLTEASSVSQYVHQEIGAALAAKKPVIPITTFDLPAERLGMLAGVEWLRVDLGDPDPGLADLTSALQRRRDLKQQEQQGAMALGLIAFALIWALSQPSGGTVTGRS